MHIFVSGAGPVGLSATIALIGRGHTVTVVDRADGVTNQSRAVGVNRRSLRRLAPCGAAAAIVAAGERVRTIRILSNGEPLTRLAVPGGERARWPALVALPQSKTEAILHDILRREGGAVRWGHETTALRQDRDRVTATITERASGSVHEIVADAALGADGSRSATRRLLNIAFEGRTMPETWSLADTVCDWPWPDEACAAFSDHHDVTVMITIGDGRCRVIANHPRALQTASSFMTVRDVVRADTFTVDLRVAETLGKGRVCLAGDAVHTHSPVGGLGMNLGIADAFAFATAIDRDDIAGYRRKRLEKAYRVVRGTDRAYRFATLSGPFGHRLRNAVLVAAGAATRILA